MPKAMNGKALARQNDVVINRARVQAASDGAAIEAAVEQQIGSAVEGDLVNGNPYIAAKFQQLQDQIDALDPP